MRLIDADDLKDHVEKLYCNECESDKCRACCIGEIKGYVDNASTVDAKEVVHAHWEHLGAVEDIEKYECSNCKTWHVGKTPPFEFMQMFNYCPHCGAKMDEVEEKR